MYRGSRVAQSHAGRDGRRSMRGRYGGGGDRFAPQGPPDNVQELGIFLHPCEGELVCKASITKVPYFNAFVFKENKEQIGKVDEIFGTINDMHFTVKLLDGLLATGFKGGDKVYIAPDKLLPLSRFLPQPKGSSTTGGVEKKRILSSNRGYGAQDSSRGRGRFSGRRGGMFVGRGGIGGRGRGNFRGRGGGGGFRGGRGMHH
jgi:H/ACA ribonucleoprotein complex subunit 1